MALTLHSIAPKRGSRTKSFRIGRGHGTGRGKTAGRGTKGQRARTGGRNKLKMLGMKQMLLAYPKMRGFQSRYAKDAVVTVAQLNRMTDGAKVDMLSLKKAGIVNRSAGTVKIIQGGVLTKKVTVKGLPVSAGAKTAIEKAGGTYVGKA
jgi:large subunit ribosomal protein L15